MKQIVSPPSSGNNMLRSKTLYLGLACILLLSPVVLFSQISLRAPAGPSFNRAEVGKMVASTVIYDGGKTAQVMMKLQVPEQLKKADNLLTLEITDQYPDLKKLAESSQGKIKAGRFEAFVVDNNLWVNKGADFVVVTKQGGIQEYYIIKGDYKENTVMLGTVKERVTWKAGESVPGTDYKAMVADCPEIAEKLQKNYSNLDSIMTAYNLWYEKQYPGRIKYIFQSGPAPFPVAPKSVKSFKEEMQASRERKDSIQKAMKDRMAARPTTPAPAIASKAPNVPPKKETFSAKVKRLESEGNKIGVMIESQKIVARTTGGGCVEGPKEKTFEDPAYAKTVADKLNELYQTKIFEVVSIDQVPMKMVKTYTVDDWWLTCYKVVVMLRQEQAYSANVNKIDLNYDVQYFINNSAVVIEYIDDGKNSTDYLKRNYNMGDGYSNTVKYKECSTLDQFREMVNPKEAQERFEKSQAERFAKLVEKWE